MEPETKRQEKDRITVRIEEGAEAPVKPADCTEPKETAVVFFRDNEAVSAAYYRGYHDGFGDVKLVVFLLSMAVTFLAWLVVRASK